MGTIAEGADVFTLVNIFTVEPEDQQTLHDILVKATEDVIKHMPGYISANFHLSADGTRVINYAQWETEAHFRAMHAAPESQEHFEQCRRLSKPEPIRCTVSYVDEVSRR